MPRNSKGTMTKRGKRPDAEPRVGIFWLLEGRLIADSTPLSQAEPYGDALTHATSHIDFWSRLQEQGSVPIDVEYDEVPRGRVNFDSNRNRFLFMADKCIIADGQAVRKIVAAFLLPRGTKPETDVHYRCVSCLMRGGL